MFVLYGTSKNRKKLRKMSYKIQATLDDICVYITCLKEKYDNAPKEKITIKDKAELNYMFNLIEKLEDQKKLYESDINSILPLELRNEEMRMIYNSVEKYANYSNAFEKIYYIYHTKKI